MFQLLIPILATCYLNGDLTQERNQTMKAKPKLAYVYAISNKHVWLHVNTPIQGNVNLNKLAKVNEKRCTLLLKGALK